MPKIALTFQYFVLYSQKVNYTVQDELICILVRDFDIGIYASLLILSFENNKNKRNASYNNKLWVKISIKSITQT